MGVEGCLWLVGVLVLADGRRMAPIKQNSLSFLKIARGYPMRRSVVSPPLKRVVPGIHENPYRWRVSAGDNGSGGHVDMNQRSVESKKPLDWEEFHQACRRRGLEIRVSTFPPLLPVTFKVETLDLSGQTLGYISGWIAPDSLLGDRMEVRKYTRWSSSLSKSKSVVEAEIGLLMAYATCKLAKERGLDKVQFLAIYDSEFQHKKLLRYYRFIGCKPVRQVGEEATADIPLRLLYGGVGTLMEGDVNISLARWANRFRTT
ncbi:hypothetical protein AAMO2058_001421100 [Amorphochlora amoebiformis]